MSVVRSIKKRLIIRTKTQLNVGGAIAPVVLHKNAEPVCINYQPNFRNPINSPGIY